MKNARKILSLLLIAFLILGPISIFIPVSAAESAITVSDLKVNSIDTPLGIDTNPVFSWINNANGYGRAQSAYQIIVSSSHKNAASHIGDMWDSGKTSGSTNYDILYAGSPLESKSVYFYSVRVWDENGTASEWSDIARFETGIFDDAEWTAEWIGAVKNTIPEGETYDLEGASWIWNGTKTGGKYPASNPWFMTSFDVPTAKTVRSAYMTAAFYDYGIVYVNSVYTAEKVENWKSTKQARIVDITDVVTKGTNYIVASCGNKNAGDAGFIAKVYVNYTDGTQDVFYTDDTWKVRASDPSTAWWADQFNDSEWSDATVIGEYGCSPWGTTVTVDYDNLQFADSAPMLRKTFNVEKEVLRARAYVIGLGLFEMTVNGTLPDDTVLNPVDSLYEAREFVQNSGTVRYRVFDVTKLLNAGENAVAIELAGGYYDCEEVVAVDWNNAAWRDDPTARMELLIEYTDGTSETIITDESWKSYTNGPTTRYTVFCGEVYDARNEVDDWQLASFDDSSWKGVRIMEAPYADILYQTIEPMRKVKSFAPISVTKHDNGTYIVRLPEMATGWASITFDAPAGTLIKISYAERLNKDNGNIKVPLSGSDHLLQTDVYVCSGEAGETYEPKFSYKGYEYIQISGYTGELTVDDITCYVVATDVEKTGSFETSSEFVNELHELMLRTMVNNMQGKPTDTPVYEKLGWTGDFNVAMDTFNYNFNTINFTGNFLHNLRDTGKPDGHLNEYAPSPIISGWNGPVWTQMYVKGIYEAWKVYGQLSLSVEHYDYMRAQAQYNITQIGDNWIWEDNGSSLTLGDWASPNGGTSPDEGGMICNTAAVYNGLRMLAEIADELGKNTDAAEYRAAAANIYTAFNTKFYNATKGYYETGYWGGSTSRNQYRQTSNLVPLAYGLCPEEYRESVVNNLIEQIKKNGFHLDTGCIGTELLLPFLCDEGYEDVAIAILLQDTYPSWGYYLAEGSTSLWEMYKDSGIRSYDHYFLGTYDEWFYSGLGGIRDMTNGYETVTIKPVITNDFEFVNCSVDTVRGTLTSNWKIENGTTTMEIVIPVGTTSTVYFPTTNTAEIYANGVALASHEGISNVALDGEYVKATVESGSYTFTLEAPEKILPTVDGLICENEYSWTSEKYDRNVTVDGEFYTVTAYNDTQILTSQFWMDYDDEYLYIAYRDRVPGYKSGLVLDLYPNPKAGVKDQLTIELTFSRAVGESQYASYDDVTIAVYQYVDNVKNNRVTLNAGDYVVDSARSWRDDGMKNNNSIELKISRAALASYAKSTSLDSLGLRGFITSGASAGYYPEACFGDKGSTVFPNYLHAHIGYHVFGLKELNSMDLGDYGQKKLVIGKATKATPDGIVNSDEYSFSHLAKKTEDASDPFFHTANAATFANTEYVNFHIGADENNIYIAAEQQDSDLAAWTNGIYIKLGANRSSTNLPVQFYLAYLNEEKQHTPEIKTPEASFVAANYYSSHIAKANTETKVITYEIVLNRKHIAKVLGVEATDDLLIAISQKTNNSNGVFVLGFQSSSIPSDYVYTDFPVFGYPHVLDMSALNVCTHDFDNGAVKKEATCWSQGTMLYTCELCGEEREEIIQPVAHEEITLPAIPVSCTESGLTEGKACRVCFANIVEQQAILSEGHVYEDAYDSDCNVCGETRTITSAQLTASGDSASIDVFGYYVLNEAPNAISVSISWEDTEVFTYVVNAEWNSTNYTEEKTKGEWKISPAKIDIVNHSNQKVGAKLDFTPVEDTTDVYGIKGKFILSNVSSKEELDAAKAVTSIELASAAKNNAEVSRTVYFQITDGELSSKAINVALGNITITITALGNDSEDEKIAEYEQYLETVTYLDFELTGLGEPYYMGRWFAKELRGVDYMATLTDGSLLYFLVDGAESFDLDFYVNTTSFTPYFAYSIDGGAPVRQLITDKTVYLPDTGKHTVRIIADGMDESEGKWNYEKGFYLKSVTASEGGEIRGIKPTNKTIFYFGDSITEGVYALEAGPRGNSATNSYPWHCSEKLGAVTYSVGYGGSGVTTTGSFNTFINAIDHISAHREVTDGITPDVIVINHGTNDYGKTTTEAFYVALKEAIDRLREKYPDTPIVYMIPFSGRMAGDVRIVIAEYENAYVVETTGWDIPLTDSFHPNAEGAKKAGEKLADALVSIFGEDFFE